jgi:hypothetical protein
MSKPMPANKLSQAERFAEVARELECDESEEAFAQIVRKVAGSRPKVVHASDCAMCNVPAYEPGPCTCGAITAER